MCCVCQDGRLQFQDLNNNLRDQKMSTGVIFLLIICAAVGAYFMFFNESKQEYSNDRLKEIFIQVTKILAPHEEDHNFIITRKKELLDQINRGNIFSIKVPSFYTKKEIDAFEKMESEAKQEMRNVCEYMKEHKPSLVSYIEATEKTLEKTKSAIEDIKKNEPDEDADDVLDIAEKHVESSEAKLSQLKAELSNLERSIIKYQNI